MSFSHSFLCHLGFVSHLGFVIFVLKAVSLSVLHQGEPYCFSSPPPSLCLLCLSSTSGCGHDGSERHDSSDVGGLQDTQVCMFEMCVSVHNMLMLLQLFDELLFLNDAVELNQETDAWKKSEIQTPMYKLEHVSADCSHTRTFLTYT